MTHRAGRLICEAVGIDPGKVSKLVLTSEANEVDVLELTMHTPIDEDGVLEVLEELCRYRLVEIEEEEEC